eukprot:TRINITY_DN26801_c0_g1_i1.p1 TRINITY_DN26801_c0_g1~~TRINITY_DN26801_c0_g1_i1.p1  ORF type:complete len:265 (+),score=65.23 TRINITY_DN26801_c0_g1_i1:39-797(+)
MQNPQWEVRLAGGKAKEFAVLLKQRPWIGKTMLMLEEERIILIQANGNYMVQHAIEKENFSTYECKNDMKIELDIAQLVLVLDTVLETDTTTISVAPPVREILVHIKEMGGGSTKCSMPFEFLPASMSFPMPEVDYDATGSVDNFPKFVARLSLFSENVDFAVKHSTIIAFSRNSNNVCITEIPTSTPLELPTQRYQLQYLRNFMRTYKDQEIPPKVTIHLSAKHPMFLKCGGLTCFLAPEPMSAANTWPLP